MQPTGALSDLSDSLYNLTQREADVALRVTTEPVPDNLIGRSRERELVMRTNDVLATASAIRHGLGVGRLTTFVGDALPGLKRYEDTPELPRRPLWLLTHPDLRRMNRVRASTPS